jgi:c-di-GMP-binding flagellar brake protein YcgR
MDHNPTGASPRRFLRVAVALQIKFGCLEDLEAMIKASTLDLSRGGMFISTDQVKPLGQKVEIELPLSETECVRINGVIRHVRYIDGQPAGLGIEFEQLTGPALQVIEDLINRSAPPTLSVEENPLPPEWP